MLDAGVAAGMQAWLEDIRSQVTREAPELLGLFDTYSGEALFGRQYVAEDLARLSVGARLLEVGAGSMLLSCQLAREGFDVSALEPIGTGFSHFDRMRAMVLERAQALGCRPRVLDMGAEQLDVAQSFDFAFSINVMEHVSDVAQVIARVARSLVPGGSYRFTCPNYLFPYEPHFNLPTLFSKRLTQRVLGRRILANTQMPDPSGMWQSLNWIHVAQLRSIGWRMPQLQLDFSRTLLGGTLERIVTDTRFAARRSPLVRTLLRLLVRSRAHLLLRFVPAVMQPVMDCRVRPNPAAGATWRR